MTESELVKVIIMGKASRWLKGLLGMKKEKDHCDNSGSLAPDKKEKKRWSFAKPGKDLNVAPSVAPASTDDTWLRSYISETENEQNKHAIAVAAATAAAADAAVAAAQAAVAVVRLTSQGRGTLFSGSREKWGAVKIQTFFRGYLVCVLFFCLSMMFQIDFGVGDVGMNECIYVWFLCF